MTHSFFLLLQPPSPAHLRYLFFADNIALQAARSASLAAAAAAGMASSWSEWLGAFV